MDPKERLIFALDVPDAAQGRKYVELLKDHVGYFKIGLQLFIAEGPAIIQKLFPDNPHQVFLDLKLHDVPVTMKGGAASADKHGVHFLTVHGEEGEESLKTMLTGIAGTTEVLCVTVLTSVSEEMLRSMGATMSVSDLVLMRAETARRAGCHGVVCSGLEAERVRAACGDNFHVVTPGIRPAWEGMQVHDQKRVVTPEIAIKSGASHMVVGRPIRDAENPADAARKIVDEIDKALN